jgi:hypothetical protein
MVLSSALDLLQLRVNRDQVRELLGSHPAAGLPGDVAGPHGGQNRLGLQGGQVWLALPGDQLRQ